MTDRPASLLTKTQRRRLADDFADVEGAKRRRDEREIRRRVAAGLEDFSYLVDYPDEQFALALEEWDDDSVERTVAELVLLAERLRVLSDSDREAVLEQARALDSEEPSVDRVDLRTDAERRDALRAALVEEFAPSPWRRRADVLLKGGLAFLLPALALAVVAPELAAGPVGGVPALLGGVALLSGLAIVGVHGVKNQMVPAARALARDPAGTVGRAWKRI